MRLQYVWIGFNMILVCILVFTLCAGKHTISLVHSRTVWKVPKYGVFSGLYFPVFELNTGKCGPEKTPYLDTFHAVSYSFHIQITDHAKYSTLVNFTWWLPRKKFYAFGQFKIIDKNFYFSWIWVYKVIFLGAECVWCL